MTGMTFKHTYIFYFFAEMKNDFLKNKKPKKKIQNLSKNFWW